MSNTRKRPSKGYYSLMNHGKIVPRGLPEEYTNPSKTMRQEELSGDEQPPPVLPEGQYHVEKLLAQRKKGSTTEYYVWWKGYPLESCSWERAYNVGKKAKSNFHHPQPQEQTIKECIDRFVAAVDRSLRVALTVDTDFTIPFSHDVYRFLFQNKTELRLTDFDTVYFPSGWNQCYREYGQTNKTMRGRCIGFPMKAKLDLRFSSSTSFVKQPDGTFTQKARILEENVKFMFSKLNCMENEDDEDDL